jgi:formylglycine-generating enzyme required for sulfatase activity
VFRRASYRFRFDPWVRVRNIGFRCVLAAPRQP